MTIIVGSNNAGKSSILRALYCLQKGGAKRADIRLNSFSSHIDVSFSGPPLWSGMEALDLDNYTARLDLNPSHGESPRVILAGRQQSGEVLDRSSEVFPNKEPGHFVVPHLSMRKVVEYVEASNLDHSRTVGADHRNLVQKVGRASSAGFPGSQEYAAACKAILGFVVTATPTTNGQRPGRYLSDQQIVDIAQMGDGVPHIVAFLADLVTARSKLFLIEEPENDLHPKALKALLELVTHSATDSDNQFVISTHSNIVVRTLGSLPGSSVLHVSQGDSVGGIPASKVEEIAPTPQARMEVLRELGYALSDFDLWEGWLILEESSAERIIRDYLIPGFAPRLSRIRTVSASGADNIEPTFTDFYRLALFTHLQPTYRASTWVRADGDEAGKRVITALKSKYRDWAEQFECFNQPAFEHYYPKEFGSEVIRVLAIADRQHRREQKELLFKRVKAWLDEDGERARQALAQSAVEVIDQLRAMEASLS